MKWCQFTAGNGCEGPQPSSDHRSHQPMPLPADPLEGVRSVGAVKWCQSTAGNGCEGPQPPSRPPSPPNPILSPPSPLRRPPPRPPLVSFFFQTYAFPRDSPGGPPRRCPDEMVSICGRQRLRGTAALQRSSFSPTHAIAGRSTGGRPLRRRREMVSIYGRQRLRGPAAPQPSTFATQPNPFPPLPSQATPPPAPPRFFFFPNIRLPPRFPWWPSTPLSR